MEREKTKTEAKQAAWEPELCDICLVVQPVRTRHCIDCNRCVRRFDHHCPWVYNCVGERNHQFYWYFLVSELAVLIWGIKITWYVLIMALLQCILVIQIPVFKVWTEQFGWVKKVRICESKPWSSNCHNEGTTALSMTLQLLQIASTTMTYWAFCFRKVHVWLKLPYAWALAISMSSDLFSVSCWVWITKNVLNYIHYCSW